MRTTTHGSGTFFQGTQARMHGHEVARNDYSDTDSIKTGGIDQARAKSSGCGFTQGLTNK